MGNKEINFSYSMDNRDEMEISNGKINTLLWLYDWEYEIIFNRLDLEKIFKMDFNTMMMKTDATCNVYVEISSNDKVTEIIGLLSIQSDDIGWIDYTFTLTSTEQETLLKLIGERIQKEYNVTLEEMLRKASCE